MGVEFGEKQFIDYATQLASKHKLKFKAGKPSEKWWTLMKKRNQRMWLRRPEPTAAVRHMCMDFKKVQRYFEAWHGLQQKSGVSKCPKRIWNMDETGLQLEHKPQRVIAQKGVRCLHARTSGIVRCWRSSHVSMQQLTESPHTSLRKGKPPARCMGLMCKVHHKAQPGVCPAQAAWTKQGITCLWFKKSFLPNIGNERPQVLILDGHDSHNFVELLEVALANQIEIVELPAHNSNWLQPCDRTVFKPFKDVYNEAC